MTEELDRREKDNKDLEKELQQSKDSYDDLNDQKQELDGEVKFLKREMTKRDRAIHGFNKLLSAKENEIDKLTDEIKDYENKAFEISDQLHKLQVRTPHNENREKVIAQLRLQLQESDKTLQEALDDRNKIDESHLNEVRDLRNQIMDFERSNERQKNQLSSNEELITKLDGIIKEKDEELQNILNKFKTLTRDLKEACREKDKCQMEVQQLKKDVDRLQQQKEEEMNGKQDLLNGCNNKIVMLTSSLEKSNVLRRQAEDKLLADTDEFKRLTDDLQQKLNNCKNELDKLRQEKSRSDNDDDDLINKLYDEIDMKDQEIQMLQSSNSRPVYVLEEDKSTSSMGESSHHTSTDHATHHYDVTNHQKEGNNEHITYSYNVINQAQAQHQVQAPQERLQIMQSTVKENKSSRVLQEDIKQVQNSVDEINRTLTTRNETVNTTFGNVIDQSSFMQVQPSFRFNDDRELLDLGVNDLRQALREYKLELKGAEKDLKKLDESSRNQAREITDLKGKISNIENERENLINEKKTINKEKENHEEG